ncbi:MAG: bifunctional diaminohydroxyphosphoribosylaminopyrimidine deaminase/5-amino-6-(5-phosphoribosylamino)uracil reductase RibD, partial [Frankiaceae bacterium]
RAGGPHAEVVALGAAGERARGGTAVVTLEPCAHTGRTAPCTSALIDAGVRRVVVAVVDPDPVAAGGAGVLRAAGIDVEVGVGAREAEAVNEHWLHAVRTGRPFVTWKYAASLDGRVAARDGSSRWITGSGARADAHRLRAACDAVLVGVGTVLADDPELTVRDAPSPRGQPLRVVLDSRGRTPTDARVRNGSARTLVLTVAEVPSSPGGCGLDLTAVLRVLADREMRRVLVEGGPTVAGAFVDAGLVDEVVAYVAPALLGGPPAYPALAGRGAATIAGIHRLRIVDVERLGADLRVTGRPVPPSEGGS